MCGATLDAVTILNNEGKPQPVPGDYTVCLYCATMLRFKIDLSVRVVTREDLKELLDEEPKQFALLQEAMNVVNQWRVERKRANYRNN
jgi:hypothetical protein